MRYIRRQADGSHIYPDRRRKTRIEWWPKEKFRNRVTELFTSKSYDFIPIPDDAILCDLCNVKIEEFPVPVMGSYALCKKCFKDVQKGGEHQ